MPSYLNGSSNVFIYLYIISNWYLTKDSDHCLNNNNNNIYVISFHLSISICLSHTSYTRYNIIHNITCGGNVFVCVHNLSHDWFVVSQTIRHTMYNSKAINCFLKKIGGLPSDQLMIRLLVLSSISVEFRLIDMIYNLA